LHMVRTSSVVGPPSHAPSLALGQLCGRAAEEESVLAICSQRLRSKRGAGGHREAKGRRCHAGALSEEWMEVGVPPRRGGVVVVEHGNRHGGGCVCTCGASRPSGLSGCSRACAGLLWCEDFDGRLEWTYCEWAHVARAARARANQSRAGGLCSWARV